MILVVTGLHSSPFDRLVCMMDDIAPRLQEEVVIQKGASNLEITNARSFAWAEGVEIGQLYDEARVVVCHAGVGTIIECMNHQKPMVLVPRRESFGECFDNHQSELAEALSRERGIVSTEDPVELERLLMNQDSLPMARRRPGKKALINAIRDVLGTIQHKEAT